MIRHHFTVDVEEHFQVLALAPWVPRERWASHESRVAANVDRLLGLLARHGATPEDLSGQPCLGYRAPNYSIVAGREWVLDILVEEGHRYDSSLFPIRRPGYGYAAGGRDPHWLTQPAGLRPNLNGVCQLRQSRSA